MRLPCHSSEQSRDGDGALVPNNDVAVDICRHHQRAFEGIQLRGMNQDLTWDNAAQQYEEVFVAAKYQW